MTITTTTLTRAAGVAAAASGLLFIAVQVKHPVLDLSFATTTEFKVRQGMKVVMSALALAGITGMYLRQVKKTGVLGLIAYLLFGAGYLAMLGVEVAGLVVLPSIADSSPEYVSNVLVVAGGGHAPGDIGLIQALISAMGIGFLGGSLLFGIALFRANVLARWASALLAVAAVATAISPQLPINNRLFAIPTGVALVGLGYSLWRGQRSPATVSQASTVSSQLDTAGA